MVLTIDVAPRFSNLEVSRTLQEVLGWGYVANELCGYILRGRKQLGSG